MKFTSSNPLLHLVSECAETIGVEAYVVGGYVRDIFLDRPSKDIDFVSIGDGSGLKLAKAVANRIEGNPQVNVFKNFGTAMIKTDEFELEFVGARKESYSRDSRKPVVENGTLDDDLSRRDFTINALAVPLTSLAEGKVVDKFEGQEDIRRKVIKTPLDPAVTFSDDPLRMMRAIRFASQLGFDIDPTTFEAITTQKERISIVSQERIIDELNKIVLSPKPSYGFQLLFSSGLLHLIFPKMVELHGVDDRNGMKHKDNFYHTLKVLDNVAQKSDDLWLRWAAILHDIAKPDTKRFHPKAGWTFHGHEFLGAKMVPKLFKSLKLPLNHHMQYVQKLVRLHLRPIALVKEHVTDSALRRLLYEAGDDIDDLMALCRADITSKDHNRVKRYLTNFDNVEQKLKDVEERDHVRNFQPIITGDMIMRTFGLTPSKTVGDLKVALREAVLDGEVPNTFEASYAFLLRKGEQMGMEVKEDLS